MPRLYLMGLVCCTACAGATAAPGNSGPREQSISNEGAAIRLTHEDYTQGIEFDAPKDRVWKAMLAAHDLLGIPVSAVDENATTIQYFKQVFDHSIAGKSASTYVDCGAGATGPRADSYRVRLTINEVVTQALGGKTTLHTTIQASAHSTSVSGSELECSSTGHLEQRIAKMVTEKLAT